MSDIVLNSLPLETKLSPLNIILDRASVACKPAHHDAKRAKDIRNCILKCDTGNIIAESDHSLLYAGLMSKGEPVNGKPETATSHLRLSTHP